MSKSKPLPRVALPSLVQICPSNSIELSDEAADVLDKQLMDLVRLEKPHLDDEISLPKLALQLGVTSHQLSELLNIHKSCSFYDFLNELRFKESLALLTTNNSELTIADIAYRSGFNNRNSFYKVFKEKTALTPTQYKNAMNQNASTCDNYDLRHLNASHAKEKQPESAKMTAPMNTLD